MQKSAMSTILLGSRAFSRLSPLTFMLVSAVSEPLTTYRERRAARFLKRSLFHKQMNLFKGWNAQSVLSCSISFLALISSARGILTEDLKGKETSRNPGYSPLYKAVKSSTQIILNVSKELNSCQEVTQFDRLLS